MIDVSIKNTILKMEVDSGTEANVIRYSEFLKLSSITLELAGPRGTDLSFSESSIHGRPPRLG